MSEIAVQIVPILGDDIDTDRIYPARFLLDTDYSHYADYLFHDERFGQDGAKKGHSLDDPKFAGANAAIVGKNFGCGSSREHAAQALKRFGIRIIIGESFADIFLSNCAQCGIECFRADHKGTMDIAHQISQGENAFSFTPNECNLLTGSFSIKLERVQAGHANAPDDFELLSKNTEDITRTAWKIAYMKFWICRPKDIFII